MTTTQRLFHPVLTALGALAVLLAATGMIGCSATQTAGGACADCADCETAVANRFEQDRKAILGMAGEYDVTFDFQETMAIRDGYELKKPYHSEASELVVVVEDTDEFISMQHLLVVKHGDKTHIVKHWRQDWRYQGTAGYDFEGNNVWQPITYSDGEAEGAWVQSVFQVDDSPRYWGVGRWQHRDGVSTWSAATHRPLPRREITKRSDYKVLGAVNTHVVTDSGWMHYQHNRKIDKDHATQPVIAIESGVNTYKKTTQTDFSAAKEYWDKTAPYWAQVRAAWSDVYGKQQTLRLKSSWKGYKMYTHFFDLADLYWGKADASKARAEIDKLISAFNDTEQVAQP